MRFNPPPNWPVSPGWTPDPGWSPDPSWPPAPPGWQFWVDDSSSAQTAQIHRDPQQAAPPAYQGAPQWQPPGVPPFTGPPGPPPTNRRNRNLLIAAVVGAVVVIGVVVALVVGLSGSDSKSASTTSSAASGTSSKSTSSKNSTSPRTSSSSSSDDSAIRTTVSALETAWNADDYETFASHVCGGSSSSNAGQDKFEEQRQTSGEITFHVKKVTVTGSTAKVDVDETFTNQDDDSETLDFKKEDGSWKLC